jgi:hypothetical protein
MGMPAVSHGSKSVRKLVAIISPDTRQEANVIAILMVIRQEIDKL